MNGALLFNAVQARWGLLRNAILQLPVQARSVLFSLVALLFLLTTVMLINILAWWVSSAAEISSTKPRISRLQGYIEAAPEIDASLSEVIDALSEVAIEDTGDTGRGGALLQQQLRQLAGGVGLTVVGSEVKEPEVLEALVKLNATLQVTGGPDDFDEFLRLVYGASPALFPEAIKLEAMRRLNRRRQPSSVLGVEDHISARVDISAYRLGGQDG